MSMTRRVLIASMAASAGLYAAVRPRPVLRRVLSVVPVQPTRDGAGVRLGRAIGGPALPNLDPFLLLDEFKSDNPGDYIAGFPDHPHRGFETVTVMIDGAMQHRDSVGNHGLLGPGSLQWMTAGRGIVHSEMPKQVDGLMWGFQLWVNLPARLKMTAPRYQDIAPSAVPRRQVADADVRVLAGEVGRVTGPVDGVFVQPTLLDVTLPAGGELEQPVPWGHTVFLYVTDGEAVVEGTRVPAGHLAALGPGDAVGVTGRSRFLLAAGAPIGEPIARRGPFVMNTQAELEQAFADYRAGRLGT
ncbi:MAG TPA: pirin family protein [Myxococcota bacterium]|nr:pirin family protein [Myxococcota bacterium]